MRKCELCECAARMYCESDQASLCWDCDEKVHRANFLVAKHSRSLLCHVCQSLTPWKASGPKLGPTVSVCDACVAAAPCGVNDHKIVQQENQSEESSGDEDNHPAVDETEDEEDDYDDEDDDEDLDDNEEEDENQVVPWSGDSQSSPPPPPLSSVSCSSISEEDVSLKRIRDFADLYSDDEIGSSSQPGSRGVANDEATTSLSSFRPLKQPRTIAESERDRGQVDSRSTAIVSSLQRLQNQIITNDGDASATIIGICRLSRNHSR
ncbi:Zinc finger, B-box [Melia azedarach]|uniref:Zinc finger, B-box n=2 Tax=Melia azedarach TaxID=155640 RepID=A0ACC1YQX2_MELAZ|nr:Zinc finger, B-box [Melia azedarach]KAJ4726205.1 Zinc finger, B-box [Melia azedarach]